MNSPSNPSSKPRLTRAKLVAGVIAVLVCCGVPLGAAKLFLDSNRATTQIIECDLAGPVARVRFTITNGGLLNGDFDVKVSVTDAGGTSIGDTTERVPNLHAGATLTRDTAIRYSEGAQAKNCAVEIE